MKIKLIITEARADYALLDSARNGDQDAKDKLKRIGKRRGINLSVIQPLLEELKKIQIILDELKNEDLSAELVATHVRTKSFKYMIDINDMVQYLPYIVKFAKNVLKINYAELAYLLAYGFHLHNSTNENIKNSLRKYASQHANSAYEFAKVIDRSYHPDTLRGIMNFRFSRHKLYYLDNYLYRFRNIPKKELTLAEAELNDLRSAFPI